MSLAAQLELLPERLGQHLALTLVALAAGLTASVPLSWLALRWPRLRWPLLAFAGVVQTVPSLALLALMVPLLDWLRRHVAQGLPSFGFWPAALALVLYSLLPVLRNTVTGLTGVDPTLLEAAHGLGMTPRQVLLRVQVPLALPVILSGVRTATVWTVGVATLSTPVGQASLGNYLFAGLQTRDWTAVGVGCVAAAGLALVLDGAVALLETAAARRSRWRLGVAALVLLTAGAVAASAFVGRGGPAPVRLGAKTFTEQYLLAEVLADSARAAGFAVERVESLGSTIIFDALASGELDAYVDYTGTLWANHLRRTDVADPDTVLREVTRWLAQTHGITCLGRLGFENAYALAMRRDRAEALGVRTLEDLARRAPALTLGGDYEFFERPEWTRLREVYGLAPREQRSFDATFLYEAVARGEVDVITAFSSDGRLAAYELLVLEDVRRAFPPYDAVLLLGPRAAPHPGLADALRPLVGALDVELMRAANQRVDVDGEDRGAAGAWLAAQLRSRARR